MISHFNTKEFQCLMEDLKESNPEMGEAELLELASLVYNVQAMPQADAPKDLFEKVKSEINNHDSIENYIEDTGGEKALPESSWLDYFVSNLQAYLLPFSSGAVAMLVIISVFDFPKFNSNHGERFEFRVSDTDDHMSEVKVSSSVKLEKSSVMNTETKILEKISKAPQKQNIYVPQRSIKYKSYEAVRPTKIGELRPKKLTGELKAMGMDTQVTENIAVDNKPGRVRSRMMASVRSRKDDWSLLKSNSKKVRVRHKNSQIVSVGGSSSGEENFSSYASLSSDVTPSNIQLNSKPAVSNLNQSISYREALEIHWKISLEELEKARGLIKKSSPDTNHIRHLGVEDLNDYSEIRGRVLVDSFFLKLDVSDLKSLTVKANQIGTFWVPDRSDPEISQELKNYLIEFPVKDTSKLDIRLMLIIDG